MTTDGLIPIPFPPPHDRESICEPILPPDENGHWYLRRPQVIQAVIPMSELRACGVAHVQMPAWILGLANSEVIAKWIREREAEANANRSLYRWGHGEQAIDCLLNLICERLDIPDSNCSLRAIWWESNNWHYDIGPFATKETYNIESSLSAKDWNRIREEPLDFMGTLAIPTAGQGPTVCKPWSGEYEGKCVQAPEGYMTVFARHAVWHRGDRWLGSSRALALTKI